MQYNELGTVLLIEKCVEKDGLAWAEFLKRFSPIITFSIKKALIEYCGDRSVTREEVKDIRQDVFTLLWGGNKLARVRQRENINYWLTIVARNTTVNSLRKKGREALVNDESFFDKLPAGENEKNLAKRKTANTLLTRFYNGLSPKQKVISRLYFEKELKMKDIAKIMDIPLGSISSVITRIRKKMRG